MPQEAQQELVGERTQILRLWQLGNEAGGVLDEGPPPAQQLLISSSAHQGPRRTAVQRSSRLEELHSAPNTTAHSECGWVWETSIAGNKTLKACSTWQGMLSSCIVVTHWTRDYVAHLVCRSHCTRHCDWAVSCAADRLHATSKSTSRSQTLSLLCSMTACKQPMCCWRCTTCRPERSIFMQTSPAYHATGLDAGRHL